MSAGYWLTTSGDDLTPRPPLDGDGRADVVVVGGGFTGLWTAWYLLERDPTLQVVVVEARTVGFGASGRNGAWLSPNIAVTPDELARRTSPEAAAATIRAVRGAVDEIVDVCTRIGLDAQIRRGGVLRIARGGHEQPALQQGHDVLRRLGVDDGVEVLDADELAARIRVADARGALFDRHGAVVHPGRLVRGLARHLEARGARIVEGTRVTDVRPGPPAVTVVTDRGELTADAVVLATEAWLPQLPRRARDVMPVYSLIVLTEPIDDDRWAQIGWQGHECLSSHRYTVDYLSRTIDGRILFGGRGAPYHFGSAVAPAYDHHEPTHAELRRQLVAWFPALQGVAIAAEWGGPLGMPRDWLPSFRFDVATGIGAAYGYTGQGVATSNLAGRVLADLVVTGQTEFADLPMVGHRPRRWEPEPLRWLAARYLQGALARIDARGARTGRPPTGRSLAERLVKH
ncbi:NAD(P)/FAD-dependent oxidoreductase [Egicoccus sp. AB-alg2]|uniref:NAD(P)/FAD-dependent oxidoreductase n=1 Tax=Egicoccus sp. AB-alg2 TaxID=3242693 RepID=UPI00359E5D25